MYINAPLSPLATVPSKSARMAALKASCKSAIDGAAPGRLEGLVAAAVFAVTLAATLAAAGMVLELSGAAGGDGARQLSSAVSAAVKG